MAYAKACVQPAYMYFQEKFDNDLKPVLLEFKAARYFSPSKVHELKPSAIDLDSLCKFTFLNSSPVIDGLKSNILVMLRTCLIKQIRLSGGSHTKLNFLTGLKPANWFC